MCTCKFYNSRLPDVEKFSFNQVSHDLLNNLQNTIDHPYYLYKFLLQFYDDIVVYQGENWWKCTWLAYKHVYKTYLDQLDYEFDQVWNMVSIDNHLFAKCLQSTLLTSEP